MKNIISHIAIIILLFASRTAMAQSSATASAAATIVTPIAISKTADMNFGNVAVSTSAGGSVILTTSNSRSTGGSGVTLPATSGTVAAAAFTVSGAPAYTYAITLPSTCSLSDGSGHSMTVHSFTSLPAATGTLSSGGIQTLKVSATMNVAAAQTPGSYTNVSGVPVTVNYN